MSERISITEAAERLGISRPRLSRLIDANGIQKTGNGKTRLVDVTEVQALLSRLAAEQKIKTPAATRKKATEPGDLTDHLKEELRRLKTERDELADQVKALQSVQAEVKLLKAAETQKDNTIENLTTKIEQLEAQIQTDAKAKLDKYDKVKGSIVGRLLGL